VVMGELTMSQVAHEMRHETQVTLGALDTLALLTGAIALGMLLVIVMAGTVLVWAVVSGAQAAVRP
jgi:hypothetical protein